MWRHYQAILLVGQGQSTETVAASLGCRRSSVYNCIDANQAYTPMEELVERAVHWLDALTADDVPRCCGLRTSKFNWLHT